MTLRPTREEIDQAWGSLESLTVRHVSVHACARQHADGQLSELTAKLVAVDALRNQVRRLGGQDCSDHMLRNAVQFAVRGPAERFNFEPLHALLMALAQQVETWMRQQIEQMDRTALSAMTFKLSDNDLLRLIQLERPFQNREQFLQWYGLEEAPPYILPIANRTNDDSSEKPENFAENQ